MRLRYSSRISFSKRGPAGLSSHNIVGRVAESCFGQMMVLPPFGSPLRAKLAHAAVIRPASNGGMSASPLVHFLGSFLLAFFGSEDDFAARRASIRNWQEPFAIVAWRW